MPIRYAVGEVAVRKEVDRPVRSRIDIDRGIVERGCIRSGRICGDRVLLARGVQIS
jgi:hypothetical protein